MATSIIALKVLHLARGIVEWLLFHIQWASVILNLGVKWSK